MWDLPGPGLKPVSPALEGGFLITAPPGKSHGANICVCEKVGAGGGVNMRRLSNVTIEGEEKNNPI